MLIIGENHVLRRGYLVVPVRTIAISEKLPTKGERAGSLPTSLAGTEVPDKLEVNKTQESASPKETANTSQVIEPDKNEGGKS